METATMSQEKTWATDYIGIGGGGGAKNSKRKQAEMEAGGDENNSGGCGGGGGDAFIDRVSGSSALCLTTSERTPPPFLRKAFEMVEDPETDSIISWSSTRTSFIIWDTNRLSIEILPKYFKRSNFTSFICQLNNYGFKKIHWQRCEYANEWFQGGKKHLLKNIKRRNQHSNITQQGAPKPLLDSAQSGMETQLENLRHEENILEQEFLKLKEDYQILENLVVSLKRRVQSSKLMQRKMLVYLEQLILMLDQKTELESGEMAKRETMVVPQSCKNSVESLDTDDTNSQSVHGRNQVQEELTRIQTEVLTTFLADDVNSPIQDQKASATTETNTSFSSCDLAVWKKLLEDGSSW